MIGRSLKFHGCRKKKPNSKANVKAQYQKGPIENGTQPDVHPKLEVYYPHSIG